MIKVETSNSVPKSCRAFIGKHNFEREDFEICVKPSKCQRLPCHGVKRVNDPGFSFRQVEGLQGILIIQRKRSFQLPHCLVKAGFQTGACSFFRDLGGLKSPILGPCFENHRHTNWPGVCWAFRRDLTRVLGSYRQTEEVSIQEYK